MKILIPTDFSKLSLVAVNYALAFGETINATIVLIHIIDTATPPRARLGSRRIGEAIKKSAEDNMHQLIESIKKSSAATLEISGRIHFGQSINETLKEFAIQNDIDIIFVGTKGASGVKKMVLGSNAAAIIESSSVPVITVPEYARFNGLHHIVYATDLSDIHEEMDFILPIAKLFKAWIHAVHIAESSSDSDLNTAQLTKMLIDSSGYSKIKVENVISNDITSGINEFTANVDGDFLVMFTHKLSFIEKLFGKGITRDVAYQTRIPLFSFNKKHLSDKL
jgi:nucleotide-binding universal stress UspA family protein